MEKDNQNNDLTPEGVANRLRKEMERLGWDSKHVAKITDITERAQNNYERGTVHPKTEYWQALQKKGMNTHYVMHGQTPQCPLPDGEVTDALQEAHAAIGKYLEQMPPKV